MLSKIQHQGWQCVRLATTKLELIAPLEIGPRIVTLRPVGNSRNFFVELEGHQGGRNEPEFRARGGHRLWHAPEDLVRTYQPDNLPPRFTELPRGRGFELTQAVEVATGLQKAMRVEAVAPNTVRVTHTLTNRGLWPVETAAWALTMLRVGGFSIVPLPPKGAHPRDLLPEFSLVPWPYTDFSLRAWKFFPSFIRIETRKVPSSQKLGLTDYFGWSAYWLDGNLFIKTARIQRGATYPDRGCVFETYADPTLTELETLSPLQLLAPNRRITHVETWGVLERVPKPASEEIYRAEILPAVTRWLKSAA